MGSDHEEGEGGEPESEQERGRAGPECLWWRCGDHAAVIGRSLVHIPAATRRPSHYPRYYTTQNTQIFYFTVI